MDLKHVALLLAVAAPLGASPAFAGELELPLGVSWCEVQSNVEFSMEDPREVAGDVLESTASVWGMEGFVTMTFDEDRLVGIRLRFFEDEDTLARSRRTLEKMLGPGGESGKKVHWSLDGGGQATMRVQSEQVYVLFEIDPARCGAGAAQEQGLTDQEKADLDATEKKDAITWDPYADADPDAPIVTKPPEEVQAAEEEDKKKKEEEEKRAEDIDIDWD